MTGKSARPHLQESNVMFERFSTAATQVVSVAQREADVAGAETVNMIHLLRGLLAADGCGRRILETVGVDRELLDARSPSGGTGGNNDVHAGFSAPAKDVLKQSWRKATSGAGLAVGTDHITQAFMDNEVGRRSFSSLSIDIGALARALSHAEPTGGDRELPRRDESDSRQPASKVDRELRYH
ncbi:Clp protease N-terminal domain-containing protein [Amycolatopsis sp. NPDC005232]|uniref:Clp protease N-terminal domain-containing protein n=1 Tax=Amycolatopsis sp. NPDC005232 TaxID=3157027 RepID=UPI0033BF279A